MNGIRKATMKINFRVASGILHLECNQYYRQMRAQLIDLFEPYKPALKIIYVETTYKKLKTQNQNRDFAIPGNVVERMIYKLKVPKLWEAVEAIYVVD